MSINAKQNGNNKTHRTDFQRVRLEKRKNIQKYYITSIVTDQKAAQIKSQNVGSNNHRMLRKIILAAKDELMKNIYT